MMQSKPDLTEIDTIYTNPTDRYIVSLIAGYSDEELEPWAELMDPELALDGEPPEWAQESPVLRAKAAANAALDLTRDDGSRGTHWFVYDRQTKTMHCFEQSDFDQETA